MLQGKTIDPKAAKQEYIDLYNKYITREGADNLLGLLEKSDFFTAPASSRFHNSVEGGLCQHSLNVYYCLKDVLDGDFYKNVFGFKYSDETIAVAALLHDLCKIDNYVVDYKNAKNERGEWERVPFYKTNDQLPYGHGEKSVYMIQAYMKLSREEAMAIRWHMGFTEHDHIGQCGQAFEMFPLAFALSTADMMATYYVEGRP